MQGSWLKVALAKASFASRDWLGLLYLAADSSSLPRTVSSKKRVSKQHSVHLRSCKKGSPLPIPAPKRVRHFDATPPTP